MVGSRPIWSPEFEDVEVKRMETAALRRFRMRSQGSLLAGLMAGLLLAAAGLAAGCGEGRPGRVASRPADAEWDWLQQTKERLDAERARLARIETAAPEAVAGTPAGPATSGSGPRADLPPAPPDPAADPPADQLRREIDRLAADFGRRLVGYINAHPPVQGEPLDERQRAALRMRSDEEIVQGRAYIERGGDYQRAIEIYEAALAVDPGNAAIEQELARARQMRYMTPERFAKVEEGMTPAQVRALLGQPNLHNVREYEERGVLAWFYPKDASGAAAAVWFHREKQAAGPTVYMTDFEAVRTDEAPRPAPVATPAAPTIAPATEKDR